MLKKLVVVSLLFALIGLTGPNAGITNAATPKSKNYSKELTIVCSVPVTEMVTLKEDLEAKFLKDKFNIICKYENYPKIDWPVKLMILLASGDGPEFFHFLRGKNKEWADAGHLRPFTQNELDTRLPNYAKIWATPTDYKTALKLTAATDGKTYYLPTVRNIRGAMGWMYRKETFDKYGLKPPQTPDEFITTLRILKDKTGMIPYVSNAIGDTPLWAFSNFFTMFGLPDLTLYWQCYQDPISKKFVADAMTDNRVRPLLIFLNKMYRKGLLPKDCATLNNEMLKRLRMQGHGFVMASTETDDYQNNLYKSAAPDVNWTWYDSYTLPSAFADKTFHKGDPPHSEWGPAISAKISKEKADRILDWLNWAFSEEGQIHYTYGFKGVTYELNNGKLQYLPKMVTPIKSDGDRLASYGVNLQFMGLANVGWVKNHIAWDQTYNGWKLDMLNKFRENKYYTHEQPSLQYTAEENKKLVELTATLYSVRDEYWLKFVLGLMDPTNDSDWKKFQDAMDKAGRKEVVKLRTIAYKRSN